MNTRLYSYFPPTQKTNSNSKKNQQNKAGQRKKHIPRPIFFLRFAGPTGKIIYIHIGL